MQIDKIIRNSSSTNEYGVHVLNGHEQFDYSDGSERYLLELYKSGFNSDMDWRKHAKTWALEYHLTPDRRNLFLGFDFDYNKTVLEVGCGCGAITEYLVQNFSNVVSVEGSIARANVAKTRNYLSKNLEVISAPYQDIQFATKFDYIFCVGVFEYSGYYVNSENPYDEIICQFSDLLAENGVLIIAIENKFGSKYFCGVTEDHVGLENVGIEGYHYNSGDIKTFSMNEHSIFLEKRFAWHDFFFPFPDYKLPKLICSRNFLDNNHSSELINHFKSRDYNRSTGRVNRICEPLFNTELVRAKLMAEFSNSFIIIAGKSNEKGYKFKHEAIWVANNRKPGFNVKSTIDINEGNGSLTVNKSPLLGNKIARDSFLEMNFESLAWINGYSFSTMLLNLLTSKKFDIADISKTLKPVINYIRDNRSTTTGMLDGSFVDANLSNFVVENGNITKVDNEFRAKVDLPYEYVVYKIAFDFLETYSETISLKMVAKISRHRLIVAILKAFDVRLTVPKLQNFLEINYRFQYAIAGDKYINYTIRLIGFIYFPNILKNLVVIRRRLVVFHYRVSKKIREF